MSDDAGTKKWFVYLESRPQGPLTSPELLVMVGQGKVHRATLVSTDGKTWRAAETIHGIPFPATEPPSLPSETVLQPTPIPGEPQTSPQKAEAHAHADRSAVKPFVPAHFWRRLRVIAALVVVSLIVLSVILVREHNDATVYFDRGLTDAEKGQNDEAIKDFDKAIAMDPKDATAYYFRGNTYSDKHQYDQAIKDYDQAITLDPKDAKAYFNRGCAYHEKGQYDQAIKDYDQAIALDPKYGLAYYSRGYTYSDKGENDQAIKDFSRVIALDQMVVEAYFERGNIYARKGQYEQAIKDFDEAIGRDHEFAPAYYRRGCAYYNLGLAYDHKGQGAHAIKDWEQAITDFDQAIALDPKLDAAYGCGLAYSVSVMTFTASKEYDKAWAAVKAWRQHGGKPTDDLIKLLTEASGRSE